MSSFETAKAAKSAKKKFFWWFSSALLAALAALAVPLSSSAATLSLRDVGPAVDANHIEFRGVGAGPFNAAMWEKVTLHLVPDARSPLLEPRPGKFRNIYAPSVVQTASGFRIYYGGWDGTDSGNDRIYAADTADFFTFENRHTVIEHGTFQHVCNVNVTPWERGFAMMCTAYPDAHGRNKPVTFFSGDGESWNGARDGVFAPTPEQLVRVDQSPDFAASDINGVNVLLRDRAAGKWRMYFGDFGRFGTTWRASGDDGRQFSFDAVALHFRGILNDVKSFRADGRKTFYLMALHANGERLFYAVSSDGLHFQPPRELCRRLGDADRYIVAVCFVTTGEQDAPGRRVLGILYGAGAAPTLDANRIFARWLQKKLVFTAADGTSTEPAAALGPDRQVMPAEREWTGRVQLFGEDGVTAIAADDGVSLKVGRAYAVQVER